MLFAFTWENGYYFGCKAGGTSRNCPTTTAWNTTLSNMKTIDSVAFGPNSSYVTKYNNLKGVSMITAGGADGQPAKRIFKWWQDKHKRTTNDVKASFGDNGRWFAVAGNGACYWSNNVHASLIKKAKNTGGDKIVEVSLGADDYYVARQKSGSLSWAIPTSHELCRILKSTDQKSIEHVVLSPTNKAHFFIAYTDGSCRFCVPNEWRSDIEAFTRRIGIACNFTAAPLPSAFAGYSGYSARTNTAYQSQAVAPRNQGQAMGNLWNGLSAMSSIMSIGVAIAGFASACTVM